MARKVQQPRLFQFCPACGERVSPSGDMVGSFWWGHLLACGVVTVIGPTYRCICDLEYRPQNDFVEHIRTVEHNWEKLFTLHAMRSF